MPRSLVCAAAIFFLLASVYLIPQNVLARRCPVKMPETLLSLYQNSDSIYIAEFDRLEEGKVVEDNDDYTAVERRKHFVVSTALKGQAQKFFVLNDTEYRYKAQPEQVVDEAGEPETVTEDEETEPETETKTESEEPSAKTEANVEEDNVFVSVEPQLAAGDTVLLFVRNGVNKEDAAQLTDFRDGLKKLSGDRLAAYEKRIIELNGIFAEKKVDHDRLLEWLIRCAQDPLTRWEGTYELLSAVQQLEWREQAAQRRRERIAAGQPVEVQEVEPAEGAEEKPVQGRSKNIDTSIFARLIDPNQKLLLANILLEGASEPSGASPKPGPVHGDGELLELIKRWGDPRLLSYLLDSLRGGRDEPSLRAENMVTIADLLDDDEASSIADKYREIAWEDESAVVGKTEEEESADAEADVDAVSAPGTDTPPEPESSEKTKPLDPDAASTDAPRKKQTYKELRDELMQKFIARCGRVIADREKEKVAEESR